MWGLTYDIHPKPIHILQKKAFRAAITFNKFATSSILIFSKVKILKLHVLLFLKLLNVLLLLPHIFRIILPCCHLFINMIQNRQLWMVF